MRMRATSTCAVPIPLMLLSRWAWRIGLLGAMSCPSVAEEYVLTLQDHHFTPQVLTIPAGERVKITVINRDDAAAEFESSDLDREKVVAAKSQITVYVGPMDAGTYQYCDDFHRDTTTGTIVAH
jgi:plastocyanin